jgi:hypothetical protein
MFSAKEFNKPAGGGIKIPVGVHEGVTFSGVTKEKTWYDISFHNSDGRSIYKRLFEPSGSNPKEGETVTEAIQREQERNARILTEVMYAVLDKEIVDNFSAPTYQAFVDGAVFYLNPKKGASVNLKVIPDYKEKKYPELPLRNFVEAHVTGQAPSLKMSKKELDDVEKMMKKREEERDEVEASNDLPF